MKIRTRLTLLFTLLAASVLLIYAFAIYWSARENREKEFYDVLAKEAITKANLFLNAKVPTQSLHDIYLSNREILNEVEVALYTTNFELLYHDAVEIDVVKETPELLEKIVNEGTITFYQDKWQVLGVLYAFEGQNYIVTATALDQY
ncbi:MAG: two-component sensor histidine kinase, partial [Flavobacteriales bacterium]